MTDKQIAEKAATWERPLGSDPRDPQARADRREIADTDLLVERPDLDSTSHVFVAAGDPVPAELAPQPPAAPAPSATAKRRKAKG